MQSDMLLTVIQDAVPSLFVLTRYQDVIYIEDLTRVLMFD